MADPDEVKLESFKIDFGNGAAVELKFGDSNDRASKRQCGSCTLCCRLLPVPPLNKLAGQKCPHQRHKQGAGCAVYQDEWRFPKACAFWSCRWLVDPACNMPRPDRCHFVIDCLPDQIQATDHGTGQVHAVPCLQIWVDPFHPEAHRDPRLLAFVETNAQQTGMVALIRCPGTPVNGTVLIPPFMTQQNAWIFKVGINKPDAGVGLWEGRR